MVCCVGPSIRPSVPVLPAFISGCAVHMSHIQLAPAHVHTQLHLCPPRAVLRSQPIAGRSAKQNCSMWVWTEAWFSVYKLCVSCCNLFSDRMLYICSYCCYQQHICSDMECFVFCFDYDWRYFNHLHSTYCSFKHKPLVLWLIKSVWCLWQTYKMTL